MPPTLKRPKTLTPDLTSQQNLIEEGPWAKKTKEKVQILYKNLAHQKRYSTKVQFNPMYKKILALKSSFIMLSSNYPEKDKEEQHATPSS